LLYVFLAFFLFQQADKLTFERVHNSLCPSPVSPSLFQLLSCFINRCIQNKLQPFSPLSTFLCVFHTTYCVSYPGVCRTNLLALYSQYIVTHFLSSLPVLPHFLLFFENIQIRGSTAQAVSNTKNGMRNEPV
jgi:hypothetical protein